MGYTFGEMVLRTLKKEGIRREDLYRGICDKSMFSRYMKGTIYLDRLLMTAFLQRMGKSPDKFCSTLTEEEYIYFRWRHKAELAQQQGDWAELERLLGEADARVPCNVKLQRQFMLLMQAILQEKLYGSREECLRLLEEALAETLPDFVPGQREGGQTAHEPGTGNLDVGRIGRLRLGTQEINILLLWQALQPDRELAFRLLGELVKNIESCYTDRQEQCKIYPKAAAQYLAMLDERGMYYEGLALAGKALALIGDTGCVESLCRILRQYAAMAEKVQTQDCAGFREQYEVWKKIMGKYGRQEEDAISYLFCMTQEISLFQEMIRGSREEKGYTQEELSAEICATATLSKIENGRKPLKKVYQALAGTLHIPEEIYYSTIISESFGTLELRWEYETQVNLRQFQKAAQLKDRLKEQLDCAIVCNKQYIEQAELVLKMRTGTIGMQDCFGRMREILGYSIPGMPEEDRVEQWPEEFWRHVFTEREMSLLLLMADTLFGKKEWGQAVCLLEKMLGCYGRSMVSLDAHYRIVTLIYGRLTTACNRLGLYRETLEYAEKGLQMSLRQGSCAELYKFLGNKAYALVHLGDATEAAEYYRMSFMPSKMFLGEGDPIAARSYKSLTGKEIT